MAEMATAGMAGSVVTLVCEPGEPYRDIYCDDSWLAADGCDIAPYESQIVRFLDAGEWRADG